MCESIFFFYYNGRIRHAEKLQLFKFYSENLVLLQKSAKQSSATKLTYHRRQFTSFFAYQDTNFKQVKKWGEEKGLSK